MKIVLFIILGFLFIGSSEKFTDETLVNIKGLDLFMCHDIFGTEGRRLTMAFSETQRYRKEYRLELNHEIVGNKIIISVVNKTDITDYEDTTCPDELYRPHGYIYIPDSLLSNKKYTLIIKTANFKIKSKLIVKDDLIELKIPKNQYFSCPINKIYPEPRNLLFGYVYYYGQRDNEVITKFFEEFEKLGLIKTTVPNYPYKYLTVDESGRPINEFSPDGGNSIGFLYKMDIKFRDAVKFMEKWYWKYYPTIQFSFYCSNGDQALTTQNAGINTFYTDD